MQCDEAKPSCKKCLSFRVLCSYGRPTTPGEGIVQPSVGEMCHLDVLAAPSLRTTILGSLNGSLMVGRLSHEADPFDNLTSSDVDILSRFHIRAIPTLETSNTRGLYQAEILTLTGQVCDPPPPPPRPFKAVGF